MRYQTNVIVAKINTGLAIHFTAQPLCGVDNNLWMPIAPSELPFRAIERIMQANHIAHNVTRLDKLREGNNYTDYTVTYNEDH